MASDTVPMEMVSQLNSVDLLEWLWLIERCIVNVYWEKVSLNLFLLLTSIGLCQAPSWHFLNILEEINFHGISETKRVIGH
jgi:hypothetical protein